MVIGIRPSDLALAESAGPPLPRIDAEVEVVENLGAEMQLLFGVDAPQVDVEGAGADEDEGSDHQLLADGRSMFTAAIPARRPVEVGERVEFVVDNERLLLFDPQSGEALVSPAAQPASAAR